MTDTFDSPDSALTVLSDPGNPDWLSAFAYLSRHPQTAQLMMETFRETLEQMGIEPSGTDPVSGEPSFTLRDVARAMGLPETELDVAIEESRQDTDDG